MKSDSATHHRAAASFALGFAVAVIASLAGVFVLDVSAARLGPAFRLETLPDASWPERWMAGAVSASAQQSDAANQWLHLILMFGAIAAAVACINALIGFLSHANERRYEMAVRGLIGASPRALRQKLMRDAAVNAMLGIASGAPLGIICALVIRRAWPGSIDAATSIGSWMLVAAFVCAAVAVFAARTAARRFHRPGWLGDALAPEARAIPGFGAEDLRMLLTTAQLACAVALTTLGLLVWSYASERADAGAHARTGVYVARVRAGSLPDLRAAHEMPGIEAESIASPGALLGIGTIDKVISECGRCARGGMYTPMFPVETQQHVVGADFFNVVGVGIRAGHEFGDPFDDGRGVIINATFARLAYDDPNPIGKRLLVGGLPGGEWYRVIGVVDDVPTTGLHFLAPENGALVSAATGTTAPAIYLSARAHPPAVVDVVVRAKAPPQLAGVQFSSLASLMTRASAPQRWFARIVMMLGMMLCAAALVGSFTTTMLSVRSRQTEIAVRRALGARRRDIWLLVYRSVGLVAARGIIAGLIVSVALSRAVETVVAGLPAFSLRGSVIITFLFTILALLAAVLPARSALNISPAQSQ